MLSRILLPLSGSSFTPIAIRHTVELAHQHRAQITGLAVTGREMAERSIQQEGAATVVETTSFPRIHRARHMVQRAVDRLSCVGEAAGVPVRLLQDKDDLIDGLIEQWSAHDLLVVGLRGLFEQDILDNASQHVRRLLAIAPTPLLAVADYYRPVDRVLVGFDGMRSCCDAVRRYFSNPLWPGAIHKLVGCDACDSSYLEQTLGSLVLPDGFQIEITPRAQACGDWNGLLDVGADWDADVSILPLSASSSILSNDEDALSHVEHTLLLIN